MPQPLRLHPLQMKPSDQPSYVDHVLMEVRHQLAALQQSIWADHHQVQLHPYDPSS